MLEYLQFYRYTALLYGRSKYYLGRDRTFPQLQLGMNKYVNILKIQFCNMQIFGFFKLVFLVYFVVFLQAQKQKEIYI